MTHNDAPLAPLMTMTEEQLDAPMNSAVKVAYLRHELEAQRRLRAQNLGTIQALMLKAKRPPEYPPIDSLGNVLG